MEFHRFPYSNKYDYKLLKSHFTKLLKTALQSGLNFNQKVLVL